MGSIEPYDTSRGRRYRVRYRKPDHSQTDKRGFRTKREAEQFLASMEISKARGAYVDPTLGRVTLERWMSLWLGTRQDLRATSRTRAAGIVAKHILPTLGPIPLADLQRLKVQQWASTIPGSPESVRKVVNVLSGALQLAIEDGRITANPAARLKLPKPVRSKRLYLDHEQVAALAAAVERRSNGRELGYGLLVLVLAYCGLRWGELSGLRVRDVDLKRGRLEVQQTVVADKGYQRIEAPKDYEHRSIPIPELLLPHLAAQIASRKPTEPVFYGARTKTWLRNHTFRNGWFDPAAIEVGLPGLTPHELRHTAASLAVSAGANVKAVQRMLGHASAAVTLDVYSDLFDDDLDAVAAALNDAARRSSVGKMWARGPEAASDTARRNGETPG
jgi:integrase